MNSTSAPVTIPNGPITDYVLRHAARLGDKPALIDGPTGRTLSYRTLAEGARRTAAGLAQQGFGKGQVLPINCPNLPEGVMLTHRNLVANLCQAEGMKNFEGFGEDDITMAVLPFFHIYGMVVIMMLGLAGGGTILVMPRFDMMEFLALVQKYRVTILPLVPPIVLGMVKHPAVAQADLSSVRLVFSGAAPLGEEMARALSAKLGCPVVQGYGMTEASPVTHLSPTIDAPVKPGSIGKVVPGTEVKIVDIVTGAELGRHQEGEVL